MFKKNQDLEYLRYFPFLSNSSDVIGQLNITIEKIEDTNIFDKILFDIYKELSLLLNPELAAKIKFYPTTHYSFEVTKYYLTIMVLRVLDNIALTRIWVKYLLNSIRFHLTSLANDKDPIKMFITLFRLLDVGNHFELKQITIDSETKIKAFGLNMVDYLDVANDISNSDKERYQNLKLVNTTLHKGMVIIGFHEQDQLSAFIELFARTKTFQLYNSHNMSNNDIVTSSKKINSIVNKLKDLIKVSEKISINVKKHHVSKELLYEQEKIKDVEKSNIIIKNLEENLITVESFPPCINNLLEKIMVKKIALSHNENILLCTYLAKKHFVKDHIVKIFSKAVNYDKKVTGYQVRFLVDKDLMPMNCINLQTEGICKKELDKTMQCERLKNPLSFR